MVQKSSSKTRKGKKGTYAFINLEPGHYYLKVNLSQEWALTTNEMGDDYHMDSDIDPLTGFSQMLIVDQGQENLDIDIGIILNPALIGTEISSFSAGKNGCEALLQWVTNSSPTGHQFEVQRSRDDVNYTTIGTVQTSGSSTDFSFTDKNPFAKGYYRLSYLGIDGEINYSSTEFLTIRCIDKTNFTLFPNPTKGAFSISYQGDSGENLRAQILDVYGRVIKEWMVGKKYHGDIDQIELDQSPGLYWIRISDGDSQSFKSILILDK